MGFWEHAGGALLSLLSPQRRRVHPPVNQPVNQPGGEAASDSDAEQLAAVAEGEAEGEAAAALQLLTPGVRTAVSPRDVVRCARSTVQ